MAKGFSGAIGLKDEDNNRVGVQHPLSVDGDSVYAKDIDISGSSIGTFTGEAISLFNDYDVEITDTTVTNPKTFTLRFNRPISTNQVAFGSKTGDLSNVKIQFKDMGGVVRGEIDDSANDTKYTSNFYQYLTPAGVIGKIVFIEMVVEFHTTDAVKLNGGFIPKLAQNESLIMGYDDSTGYPTYAKFDNGEFIIGGKIGLKDTSNNNINPATEDKQDNIITQLSAVSDTPVSFEDTSFVTGDSPVIFDLNTALGRDASKGYIVNDGAGDFTISVSNDGVAWGDEMTLKEDEVWRFANISVNSVRLTWVGTDSAYRASFI